MVGGVPAKDAIKLVNQGKWDKEIKAEKTELSAEELKQLEEQKKKLAEEIEKRRAEFEAKAKAIIQEMAGKEKNLIKKKMIEVGIPDSIIKEVLPTEVAAAPATGATEGAAKKEAKPAAEKKGK